MMTGIISVFLAVLPMGIAFAGGTPLQGSLGWGLSVFNGVHMRYLSELQLSFCFV